MQLDWILTPMAQYGFLALALAGCLALFLSLKREMAVALRSFTKSRESAAASAASLAAGLAALRQEMETTEAASLTGQKLNLTRRAQALRMQRRGESPATIAAALRLPRNEIDLLLKIQKLADDPGLAAEAGRVRSTQPA
jgi:predicted PhzF superfamily epimerase YddE/YHI9